jgi:hypothetical protein
MNSLHSSTSITAVATLVKKSFFFLPLALLVVRQNKDFFTQTISASLQTGGIQ